MYYEATCAEMYDEWLGELEQKETSRMATRDKADQTLCDFFDFYSLNLLNFFAGSQTLNHEERAERITNLYEEKTEVLYHKIYRALHYSVVREFRHFVQETFGPDYRKMDLNTYQYLWRLANRIYKSYESQKGSKHFLAYLNGTEDTLPVEAPLTDLLIGYNKVCWRAKYGGRSWGKAVALLLDKPRTLEQKQVWIDRVLDLQHNTGHILNKTDFFILSAPKKCHRRFEPKLKKKSPLNYRRYAESFDDLLRYSSHKVRKLAIANMNYIPSRIR